MNNELISIIVPVYKTEPYLRQCLDSLVGQTYENIEIICVNDGSPDNSAQILEEYEKNDNRIKVITQENQGVSAARNNGVEASSGEYIMFIDSDDWVDTDMCETMYQAVTENEFPVCMCCYIKEFEGKSTVTNLFDGDKILVGDSYYEEFFENLAGVKNCNLRYPEKMDALVSPCMQLFKKDILSDIRFVSTNELSTGEDWLYQMEIYSKADKIVYIDKPFYHYRKTNEDSITSKYKPDLFEKWGKLYGYIEEVLKKYDFYEKYKNHLENKIALSYLYLGLNEIKSANGFMAQKKRLKEIRCTNKFEDAFSRLDIMNMPVHWKLFFFLCKKKLIFGTALMLYVIEYLRTH